MMWTKNLKTEEEKKRFESSLISAKPILQRLADMLSEEEETISRAEILPEVYDTANWSHLQAHRNGQKSILRKIRQLINLDQQK